MWSVLYKVRGGLFDMQSRYIFRWDWKKATERLKVACLSRLFQTGAAAYKNEAC